MVVILYHKQSNMQPVVTSIFVRNIKYNPKSSLIWLFTIFCSIILFFIAYKIRLLYTLQDPWAEWIHAFPAVFIGISLSLIKNAKLAKKLQDFILTVFFCIIAVLSLYFIYQKDTYLGIPYMVGTGLIFICFRFNLPQISWIHTISKLTMGVYLVHPLIISAIHFAFPVISNPILVTFISFISSMISVNILRKIRVSIPNVNYIVSKIV